MTTYRPASVLLLIYVPEPLTHPALSLIFRTFSEKLGVFSTVQTNRFIWSETHDLKTNNKWSGEANGTKVFSNMIRVELIQYSYTFISLYTYLLLLVRYMNIYIYKYIYVYAPSMKHSVGDFSF